MPADQTRSFRKKSIWARDRPTPFAGPPQDTANPAAVPAFIQVLCRAEQRGQTNLRGGKARRPRWRRERCTCLRYRRPSTKRPKRRVRGFVPNSVFCYFVAPQVGWSTSDRARQTHRARPAPAQVVAASFSADPSAFKDLCGHFPNAHFRDCTGAAASRYEKYGTCARGPSESRSPCWGPSPALRPCHGDLPRNPQRRPALGLTRARFIGNMNLISTARVADAQVAPVLRLRACRRRLPTVPEGCA